MAKRRVADRELAQWFNFAPTAFPVKPAHESPAPQRRLAAVSSTVNY
jgi:hypothetical protein